MIPLSTIVENNYYHWVMESLPRLMLVEKWLQRPDVFIVVDDADIGFKVDSIALFFSVPESRILKKKTKEVLCGEIVLPSFTHTRNAATNWIDIGHPQFIRALNARLLDRLIASTGPTLPRRFVLSRRTAADRRILNEDFLLKSLPPDFSIVDTAQMQFVEQVVLFQQASVVIGIHGAGLANIVFGSKLTVVELFPSD